MILGDTMPEGALLDTSFFLRFLNENDQLFEKADKYYKYFLEKEFNLYIYTISIVEYCVGGNVDQLPLKNLIILPFNINHAKRTGEFARIIYDARNSGDLIVNERPIIINDAKLFGQADSETSISYFVTSDTRSINICKIIKAKLDLSFEIIDINIEHSEQFGLLDL